MAVARSADADAGSHAATWWVGRLDAAQRCRHGRAVVSNPKTSGDGWWCIGQNEESGGGGTHELYIVLITITLAHFEVIYVLNSSLSHDSDRLRYKNRRGRPRWTRCTECQERLSGATACERENFQTDRLAVLLIPPPRRNARRCDARDPATRPVLSAMPARSSSTAVPSSCPTTEQTAPQARP